MTDNPVLKIIEKAFGDNSLRQKLLSDMPETLKKLGVNLSPEQMQELLRALDERRGGFRFRAGPETLPRAGSRLIRIHCCNRAKRRLARKRIHWICLRCAILSEMRRW